MFAGYLINLGTTALLGGYVGVFLSAAEMVVNKVQHQALQVSSILSTSKMPFVPETRSYKRCKILDTFLYIASLFGSFPVVNILSGAYLEFHWFHPITIWSAFVGTASFVIGMDFIFVGFPVFAKLVYGGTLNTLIQGYVRHYNYLGAERIKRAFALWHSYGIMELVNSIRKLHKKLDKANQDRALKQLVTDRDDQLLKPKQFNPCILYVIFFITLGCNATSLAYRIQAVFSPSVDEFVKTVNYVVLPKASWGVRLFWLWNHCFSFVSLVFTYGIVTLIGIELITIYVNLKNILLIHLNDLQIESAKEISCLKPEMMLMMKSFEQFCRVGGTFALIAVCSSTIAVAEYVYSAAVTGAISSVAGLIAAAVNLIAIIAVGEAMEWEILRGREQIQNALMDVPAGAVKCESLRQVLQRFGNWSWKLTGRNVFVINNKLITRIFGSVVTFLIFMFQLRFTETSPGVHLSGEFNNPSSASLQVLK